VNVQQGETIASIGIAIGALAAAALPTPCGRSRIGQGKVATGRADERYAGRDAAMSDTDKIGTPMLVRNRRRNKGRHAKGTQNVERYL
jgi:hypothetical protein